MMARYWSREPVTGTGTLQALGKINILAEQIACSKEEATLHLLPLTLNQKSKIRAGAGSNQKAEEPDGGEGAQF